MLTTYRIVYGLVLSMLLGNILRTNYVTMATIRVSIPLIAFAAVLCCLFILLLGFHRIPASVFWVLVAVCEALFIWYAWFSPASPFILHEAHNLDAAAAAREITTHYILAGAVFAFLFFWSLSLPIIRSICERRTTVRV